MHHERDPQRGDIVYVNINGVLEKCEVIEYSKDTRSAGLCIVQVLSAKSTALIDKSQIVISLEELRIKNREASQWVQIAVEKALDAAAKEGLDKCYSYFDCLSDDEIDLMAPPEGNIELTAEQDEYRLMHNAIGSVGSILMTLLTCATSDKRLSDTELLALRDRAESFGNMEIVNAIDSYFDEGDVE